MITTLRGMTDAYYYPIVYPGRAEGDPSFRETILDQTRTSMAAVGWIGLVAPIIAILMQWLFLGKHLAWMQIDATDVVIVWDKLVIIGIGISCLVASRNSALVAWGRPLMGGAFLVACWVALSEDIARGDLTLSAAFTALIMVTSVLVPFRPWQTGVISVLAIAIHYVTVYSSNPLYGAMAADWIVYFIVVTIICVALRSGLYAESYRSFRLQKQTFDLAAELAESARELAQANLDLRQTQTQLVQSGKMASLGSLVAGVAHEMNTPLGAIQSNAHLIPRVTELLRTGLENHAAIQEAANIAKALRTLDNVQRVTLDASERLGSIVQALRHFARLDQADRDTVDIHEGIENALTILPLGPRKDIRIERDFGELPELTCYPNQLNQVFMNILINAVEAIAEQGTIRVITRQHEKQLVVNIADDGCGIALAKRTKIFDPGYTTKGVGVGIGLGLSIAHRIVEDHRGTIEVESEPDQGTTVTIRLPLSTI